ncbi:hypothetical protein P3T37_003342 [Kitasatospora sp. MAA4]|uniref:hypothetical protein n=1 Tax=Kitasatospora sp. MAA4 TaxID=3035093 RepID=UPI00247572DF|nr:hypothetical protein [Kitasatospora sp. MAA4]MDH6133943.1 hypothetical protein [Kitasatospora sp. MAA4]
MDNASSMTIRTYRITGDGRRIELSPRQEVDAERPSHDPLNWPACACPRHRDGEARSEV